MSSFDQERWERFQRFYSEFPTLGLSVDLSCLSLPDDFFHSCEPLIQGAILEMSALQNGAIANADEKRMVGHYWLRNPDLAPKDDIRREIKDMNAKVKAFSSEVHAGQIAGASGPFRNLLLIGIGGSALGPQFVSHALGHPSVDKLRFFSFDNTDSDGMKRTLAEIGRDDLGQTLCLVVSKSGGTRETRNGMLEAKHVYQEAGLNFGRHAVAVTQMGSELDSYAIHDKWLTRFPMWDWVGGRTSQFSAVGLLPAALQGIDIYALLSGARACDEATITAGIRNNPAAFLAASWFRIVNDNGIRNMIVLPYSDRLVLFSKYLQQLIMESLGKEKDRSGDIVHQGICVFGNKGSTDQHSYVQQLVDGLNNFFLVFIQVLRGCQPSLLEIEPGVTSDDYLFGFLMGTRAILYGKGRRSLTVTVKDASPFTIGVLIALFERAVGLFASLVNINAYHQPGVESGKRAASAVIQTQDQILKLLSKNRGRAFTIAEICHAMNDQCDIETVLKICEHLAAVPHQRVLKRPGRTVFEARFRSI